MPKGSRKRRKLEKDEEIIQDSSEDDLSEILAQIKALEGETSAQSQHQQGKGDVVIDLDAAASSDIAKINEKGTSASMLPAQGSWRNHSLEAAQEAPDDKLNEFRQLFTRPKPCPNCERLIEHPRGVVTFSATVPPPSIFVLLHVTCRPCKKVYCRGCLTSVPCTITCKGIPKKGKTCPVTECCAESRAIALFETLGGWDRKYIQDCAVSNSRATLATSKKRKHGAMVGPGGTGYGTGETGNSNGSGPSAATPKSIVAQQEKGDVVLTQALRTTTHFLPDPYSKEPQVYDLLPHASIGALFGLSYLQDTLASLLRNDSVADWANRAETYEAMIALLGRLVDCELTIGCLAQARFEKRASSGIEEWMWGEGEITWATEGDENHHSMLPPLNDLFIRLTIQCEAFLKGASRLMEDQAPEEDLDHVVAATSLCGDLILAGNDIKRAMDSMGLHAAPDKGKGKARDHTVDLEMRYSLSCEKLAFKHVDSFSDNGRQGFGLEYSNYYFKSQLERTASSTRVPKNRFHLVQELAVISTSLPPGVWVRVDEIRNEAIKIMIAGPEDTPYANGLFEFDCFLPLDYPNSAPLFHLRTTGKGQVGFNPNLYSCGKVCLSLLGTWHGSPEEMWQPWKSTLLQVESMILVELPYFNEPGYGIADAECGESISYNKDTRKQTLKWAMAEWLKDEHQGSIWHDIIVSHFGLRHERIGACIEKWAAEDRDLLYNSDERYNPYIDAKNDKRNRIKARDMLQCFHDGIKGLQAWGTTDPQ